MAARGAKAMISIIKLKEEGVGVVVAIDGQGLITIDDFAQLNQKYVEGIYQVLKIPGWTTGGGIQS